MAIEASLTFRCSDTQIRKTSWNPLEYTLAKKNRLLSLTTNNCSNTNRKNKVFAIFEERRLVSLDRLEIYLKNPFHEGDTLRGALIHYKTFWRDKVKGQLNVLTGPRAQLTHNLDDIT